MVRSGRVSKMIVERLSSYYADIQQEALYLSLTLSLCCSSTLSFMKHPILCIEWSTEEHQEGLEFILLTYCEGWRRLMLCFHCTGSPWGRTCGSVL